MKSNKESEITNPPNKASFPLHFPAWAVHQRSRVHPLYSMWLHQKLWLPRHIATDENFLDTSPKVFSTLRSILAEITATLRCTIIRKPELTHVRFSQQIQNKVTSLGRQSKDSCWITFATWEGPSSLFFVCFWLCYVMDELLKVFLSDACGLLPVTLPRFLGLSHGE